MMNKPVTPRLKKIKVKEVVEYAGHSISANGAVNFTVKASYSELVNTIQVCQMLNNDIVIRSKAAGESPMVLGMFRVKNITIDGDGESKIKFTGLSMSVEIDNLNRLPLNDEGVRLFQLMMEAEVEIECDEENEDGEDW